MRWVTLDLVDLLDPSCAHFPVALYQFCLFWDMGWLLGFNSVVWQTGVPGTGIPEGHLLSSRCCSGGMGAPISLLLDLPTSWARLRYTGLTVGKIKCQASSITLPSALRSVDFSIKKAKPNWSVWKFRMVQAYSMVISSAGSSVDLIKSKLKP